MAADFLIVHGWENRRPEGLYGNRLGVDVDVVPGGAHLDLPAGYGAWPSVLDWCLDPSLRITGRVTP